MLRQVASAVIVIVACAVASAQGPDNVIYQHNPEYNDPNTPGYPFYSIDLDWLRITIHHGLPGEVFEFEAVLENNSQYVGPGDINLVTADENAGEIVLTFVGHNGHPYGAANIKEIGLDQPGVTAVIRELNISNNLGDLGEIRAARIEGPCHVRRHILHDIHLASLFGELRCRTMRNLTVTDPTPGPAGTRIAPGPGPPGNLTRSGPVGASLLKPGQVPDCIEPTTRLEFVWSRSGRARHVVRPEEVDK